jgi:hypothetical protein
MDLPKILDKLNLNEDTIQEYRQWVIINPEKNVYDFIKIKFPEIDMAPLLHSIKENPFKNKNTQNIHIKKISQFKKKKFRKNIYNMIKKQFPELKMFNATSKIHHLNDFTNYMMKCNFDKNCILYFEPDLDNPIWKNITINIFQKWFGFPCARWVVLYLDNYAHGSMHSLDGDLKAITLIIEQKYNITECLICTEKRGSTNICTVCKQSVCYDCKRKIKNTEHNHKTFICPFCRKKSDNEPILMTYKNE